MLENPLTQAAWINDVAQLILIADYLLTAVTGLMISVLARSRVPYWPVIRLLALSGGARGIYFGMGAYLNWIGQDDAAAAWGSGIYALLVPTLTLVAFIWSTVLVMRQNVLDRRATVTLSGEVKAKTPADIGTEIEELEGLRRALVLEAEMRLMRREAARGRT